MQRRHIQWRGWQHRPRQRAVDRLWPAPDLRLTDHPYHRPAVISPGDAPLTCRDQLRALTGLAAGRAAQVIPGREGTTLAYGRTYAGRYLLVVVIAEGQEAFVVTARDMTDAEKKTFRRKAR